MSAKHTGLPRGTVLPPRWQGAESNIARHVKQQSQKCLEAYRINPTLVEEHANIERTAAQGGYGRRQIYELVQNGADAMIEQAGGRIHVLLTEDALYCANEGSPIDAEGVDAILASHLWVKRGREIGRFGLGFKSVLGVCDCPEFYSESGSFRFDAVWAERQIRFAVPNALRVPTLRIAIPVDPREAAIGDPRLALLMRWAATVVKLPLDQDRGHWLSEDLERFPGEFLLFSPHVGRLDLEDMRSGLQRAVSITCEGDHIILAAPGGASEWRLFTTWHRPSDRAKKDAGELADRDELPLAWAVPLGGRVARGRFWAFFPTEYTTTLSGILNAPWKTNEDRQNLLPGEFTDELLGAAADLIVSNLPALARSDDPAFFLDLMPARGREAPQWADKQLTELVYERAASVPSLPDQEGQLRRPSELILHPEGVPRGILDDWARTPGRPANWCHPSVETRERRPRAETLIELGGGSVARTRDWLKALVDSVTPEASAGAVIVAASLHRSEPGFRDKIRLSDIVLTKDGELVGPDPDALFLSGGGVVDPDVILVHPTLENDPQARAALVDLGISELDALSVLRGFVKSLSDDDFEPDWLRFWTISRRAEPEQVADMIREEEATHLIKARVISGEFRTLDSALLPGDIVPEDGSRDSSVTIDPTFHNPDRGLLTRLGAVPAPVTDRRFSDSDAYYKYRHAAIDCFQKELPPNSSVPQFHLLKLNRDHSVGPLDPLFELSEEGKAHFTHAVLNLVDPGEEWKMYHSTRLDAYPIVSLPSPALWAVAEAGRLNTSMGIRPIDEAVGPDLKEWHQVFPVAVCSAAAAGLLALPSSEIDLADSHWVAGLQAALELTNDDLLGRFYALAAEHREAPSTINCRLGRNHAERPPKEVTVVSSLDQFESLMAESIPALLAPSDAHAEQLKEKWGLALPGTHFQWDVEYSASGSEAVVADKFPGLRHWLSPEQQQMRMVPCSSIRLVVMTDSGKTGTDHQFLSFNGAFFYSDSIEDDDLLGRLADALQVDLGTAERQEIIDHAKRQEHVERVLRVRETRDIPEKLMIAVDAEALRRHLPATLLKAAEMRFGPPDERQLGEFALAVYGVEVLQELHAELEAAGFDPPQRWAGSTPARIFAMELGFPKEYAGFEQAKRDRLLEVDGPPNLPPLHLFQQEIADRVATMAQGGHPTRGLLFLPTGAGKTRIAVEALVRWVSDTKPASPILWVAQSDELCEQAVQSWSEAWREFGSPRERLYISRLWSTNEAERIDGGQVIVATIQKLVNVVASSDYDWLAETAFVVIDEAHGATEPSYTRVINWAVRRDRKDRCPMLGLTATPYRGNTEETRRLVARFGGSRLDDGVLGDDPYAELQKMGVLAEVEHDLLEGAELELNRAELAELRKLRRLPSTVEARLGTDARRNQALLDHILELPEDWPVLLFATSVDHAQIMAALLRVEGVAAASISAETEPAARRHYVEEFRKGRIRVLTNYHCLAAGFDAPSVRALYIARPTYSPVLYQQMIGRGLRGPLNGGKPVCLIVNVKDNILQYGEDLAFRQFEYLWRKR